MEDDAATHAGLISQGLAGRAAVVTGASSGIGAAVAAALVAEGAKVCITARRQERLESLAADLGRCEGDVLVHVADISKEHAARQLVESAATYFGHLDTVVNNAGIALLGPIVGAPVDEWRRMFDVNVLGLMYTTHAAIPHLLASASRDQGVADIVNISSVAGRTPQRLQGVYNATKFAVNAFSESLRQEITERHVRITLIEPGSVETELTEHISHAPTRSGVEAANAAITQLSAADVASSVLYSLCCPRHISVNELLLRPTSQVSIS